MVCASARHKYIGKKINAEAQGKEKKRKRSVATQTDIPQEQEWTVLQEEPERVGQEPVPVRHQGRSRGWFGWLFGTTEEEKDQQKTAGSSRDRYVSPSSATNSSTEPKTADKAAVD